ncbi:phosphatase PAP2 family protein [Streptomyces chattanoogensis]|uniref:phosphatase PAP2 family protein n=1 Tax=Streptomyces chattanoogensis TaxID=66876 RepID=UPI003699EFD2
MLLFSVPLFSVLLFAVISVQVAGHGPLRTVDERAGRAVAHSAIPSGLAEFFADLGNTVVALPVLLVVAGWAGWAARRARRAAEGDGPVRWWLPPLAAASALAAVPALVVPLKLWFARRGPPGMGGGAHGGFFPSGHAATAAVAYGVAALLLIRARVPGRARRRTAFAVAAGGALVNVGVGIGLVRRGYHWPLDVLGSWCLAGVLLAAWWAVCARWARAGVPLTPPPPVSPPPRAAPAPGRTGR